MPPRINCSELPRSARCPSGQKSVRSCRVGRMVSIAGSKTTTRPEAIKEPSLDSQQGS